MAGIYVHIPFCKSRCKYCDFFSTTQLGRRHEYCNALLQELELRKEPFLSLLAQRGEQVNTVYFGGGTPSVLCEGDLLKILHAILHDFDTQNSIQEITVEVNPQDVTPTLLQAYKAAGVNRLSMGIQTFDDDLLHLIGRRHDRATALQAVATARNAGFDNISVDLMYGLPGETMEMWQRDVEQVVRLGVEHVSAYCLSYEEGTPLTLELEHGEVAELDDDTLNLMHDYIADRLGEAGIMQYEISNYAKLGRESRHNSSYWSGVPYLGLGAGAHSYDGNDTRRWNKSDLESYISGAQQAFSADSAQLLPFEIERLTLIERHNETIMLGLRTIKGVNLENIALEQRPSFVDKTEVFIKQGLLIKSNNYYAATRRGQHILNRIIEELMI